MEMETLKELRKELGMTQEAAAAVLQVSLRSYKTYENDEKKADTDKYRKMVEILSLMKKSVVSARRQDHALFPAFINVSGQPCLVVGSGLQAYRKILVLQDFGAAVTVLAEQFSPEILRLEGITRKMKRFEPSDTDGMMLVVAAASRELDHEISMICRTRRIPINAVSDPEDCTFIFPAYTRKGSLVGAFSSSGKSPTVAAFMKKQASSYITEELAEIADFMGKRRGQVISRYSNPERIQVFHELLDLCLEKGIPSEEEFLHYLRHRASLK